MWSIGYMVYQLDSCFDLQPNQATISSSITTMRPVIIHEQAHLVMLTCNHKRESNEYLGLLIYTHRNGMCTYIHILIQTPLCVLCCSWPRCRNPSHYDRPSFSSLFAQLQASEVTPVSTPLESKPEGEEASRWKDLQMKYLSAQQY